MFFDYIVDSKYEQVNFSLNNFLSLCWLFSNIITLAEDLDDQEFSQKLDKNKFQIKIFLACSSKPSSRECCTLRDELSSCR